MVSTILCRMEARLNVTQAQVAMEQAPALAAHQLAIVEPLICIAIVLDAMTSEVHSSFEIII